MRVGTFLFGGLLGAFAVVYLNRNNGAMMSNFANAGQSVGNLVNKAKSTLSNTNLGMGANASNSNMNTNPQATNNSADLTKVEQIVNQDPNLKSTVDEILTEKKQTDSAYRMQ